MSSCASDKRCLHTINKTMGRLEGVSPAPVRDPFGVERHAPGSSIKHGYSPMQHLTHPDHSTEESTSCCRRGWLVASRPGASGEGSVPARNTPRYMDAKTKYTTDTCMHATAEHS